MKGQPCSSESNSSPAPLLPLGPPRPRAIATFLASDDHAPGAQTLLYSLKQNLSSTVPPDGGDASGTRGRPTRSSAGGYPPEIVVVVTPAVSQEVRDALCPILCTRVIEVSFVPMPEKKEHRPPDSKDEEKEAKDEGSPTSTTSHVSAWDKNCGLSKLNILSLEQYSTILYIDADCLVVKDVSHLLDIGTEVEEDAAAADRKGLIAGAPDIFPPDKFNAGVMVLRPSAQVLSDILAKADEGAITSYDGGDTGLLNDYYPDWLTGMPPSARLPFGYNAQRFLYNCTHDKRPQYWDEGVVGSRGGGGGVGGGLHIVHYSSSPKPWEAMERRNADDNKDANEMASAALSYLDDESNEALAKTKMTELDQLWQDWYQRSVEYCNDDDVLAAIDQKRKEEERRKKKRQEDARFLADARFAEQAAKNPNNKDKVLKRHTNITKRYKQLRKEGMGTKEAMQQARLDCGADEEENANPGDAVGQMFGMA